ncbi:Cytochrome p450 [Thalictrum thalictroides]|uniref:Cytochrome p450 n=1 Tax=Thalictrum thalictroides TaxID=46969 RepID=A0A7J6WF90_THATH|nr:Cytochrome p450 [Thalictrum thalictroides]
MRWPVLDILPSLLQNVHRVHEWTVDISSMVGSTIVGRGPIFGRSEMLFTCDPRNVEYMVRTNFSNYPKGSEFLETFDLIGEGIFNIDFEAWHAQRRMAHTLFTSKEFRSYISSVNRNLVQYSLLPLLANSSNNSSVLDFEDVFLRYAFDSIFTVIFGKSSNCLALNAPTNAFSNAIDDGTEAMFFRNVIPSPLWKVLRFLKLGTERKLAEAQKTIDSHLKEYISVKKDELSKGIEGKDLLAAYMKIQAEKEELANKGDKFLRDTSLSFLFAGRDSSGTSLTWFFWLLSKSPRVEEIIMEELRSVYLKKNTNSENSHNKVKGHWVFDADDLKGLVYLHAALSEALRLYPPLPMNRKISLKEDILPDGTVMKPGPRTCIGKDMAFTQMKLAAAAVLFNFQVELVEGQVVLPKPSLVLHTRNGLLVRVKERQNLYS